MKTTITFMLLAAISLAGCSRCNREADSNGTATTTADHVISLAEGDTVKLVWDGPLGRATIRKEEKQVVFIEFDTQGYGHLDGKLSSGDSTANIRFSQIFMPDGTADGPFWNEIHYDLPAAGRYVVSVAENMMAGDPWGGVFSVELNLSGDINAVPFTVAHGYFVDNNFNGRGGFKISTQDNFESFFGMATTMDSSPTPVDFDRQFAVAFIALPTDMPALLTVQQVLRSDKGLRIQYKETVGEKQTYVTHPFLLLFIEKEYDGAIMFEKV